MRNLLVLNKAGTPFIDTQADSIALIHILELGDTRNQGKKRTSTGRSQSTLWSCANSRSHRFCS